MKNVTIVIALILVAHTCLFAVSKLENIEFTSPTLEAVEYTYILEDDLSKVLGFLDETEKKVNNSAESEDRKKIRKFHLNILRAFAYQNHVSDLPKNEKKIAVQKYMGENISVYADLIDKHPNYSGIYWMTSLTFYLYGTTDFKGMSFLLVHNSEAFSYLQKAFELNPNSPTSRIAYANFDSYAPVFVGADKKRGKETIFEMMDETWPDPWLFEYNISRLLSAGKNKDNELKQESLYKLRSLYPNSWRITKTLEDLE